MYNNKSTKKTGNVREIISKILGLFIVVFLVSSYIIKSNFSEDASFLRNSENILNSIKIGEDKKYIIEKGKFSGEALKTIEKLPKNGTIEIKDNKIKMVLFDEKYCTIKDFNDKKISLRNLIECTKFAYNQKEEQKIISPEKNPVTETKNDNTKYKVTFVFPNTLENIIIEVESGKTVNKVDDPVLIGYKFMGWYFNGELYNFLLPVLSDIKLEAKWEKETTLLKPTSSSCFSYKKTSKKVTITDYNNKCNKNVIIPSIIDNLPVKTIGSYAFSNNELTSVIIPNSVTGIRSYAFYNNKITSINIPSSVTIIEDWSFAQNEIINMNIPSTITSIGKYAFYKNQLTNVTIPNSVTTIDENAFQNNKLKSIILPSGLTNINNWSFAQNTLTSINIPNGVTSIGKYAFAYNALMSGVTIPSSVTVIDDNAFDSSGLTRLTIPSGVTSIGKYAFYKNQLYSIILPNSLTSIGNNAFAVNKLVSVTIPNSISNINEYTFYKNELTNLILPNSVTSIGNYAFAINKLSNLNLPSKIKNVGNYTFESNKLIRVTIPFNVTITNNSISSTFYNKYNSLKKAGTYTATSQNSIWIRRVK